MMRIPTRRIAAALGIALMAFAGPAAAHHKPGHTQGGRPHGFDSGGDAGNQLEIGPGGITLRLDDTVIRIVNDWYQANPQVLAGYTALPPGIAMNLARGKPLPPGIAKRVLPGGLQAMLPAPPAGYGRFIVGDDLVLIELSSQLVADVVNLFAR